MMYTITLNEMCNSLLQLKSIPKPSKTLKEATDALETKIKEAITAITQLQKV